MSHNSEDEHPQVELIAILTNLDRLFSRDPVQKAKVDKVDTTNKAAKLKKNTKVKAAKVIKFIRLRKR